MKKIKKERGREREKLWFQGMENMLGKASLKKEHVNQDLSNEDPTLQRSRARTATGLSWDSLAPSCLTPY